MITPTASPAQTYRYQQEERVVVDAAPAADTVAAVAASLPASCWYQRTISEGTRRKGDRP